MKIDAVHYGCLSSKAARATEMLKGNWLAVLLVCFEHVRICRLNSTSTRRLCRFRLLSNQKKACLSRGDGPSWRKEQNRKRNNDFNLFIWLSVGALNYQLDASSGDATNSQRYLSYSREKTEQLSLDHKDVSHWLKYGGGWIILISISTLILVSSILAW